MYLFNLREGRLRYISHGVIASIGLLAFSIFGKSDEVLNIWYFFYIPTNWSFLLSISPFFLYSVALIYLTLRIYPPRESEKFGATSKFFKDTVIGVFAAITEEPAIRWAIFLFSYVCFSTLLQMFGNNNQNIAITIAIIITQLLFISYHDGYKVIGILALTALGLFLFYILFKYGIFASIVVHSMYNVLICITEYLYVKLY